jgi:NodT family efflux transporter outer membrane factor (OMF) lipoprotein
MMRKNFPLTAVFLSFALSACSLAPQFARPDMDMDMPQGWNDASGLAMRSGPADQAYWSELGSAELDQLIDIALAQNLDLQAALHRIDEARALAKVAAAPLYPQVNAGGSASRNNQFTPQSQTTNAAQASGNISWEVDLWGKNRNAAKSADYRANASVFDREALRLLITSEVTNLYTQILGFNDRIAIGANNLKNAQEVLRIIEVRFKEGAVSGLEVSQQRVEVNTLQSSLAALNEQRTNALNALAVLLGRAPQNMTAPKTEFASLTMPEVSLTPPAELLTARPDIQSAEAGLRAANADIGAARAAFFPSLTLSADMVIAAGFGNPASAASSLAASLLAPIFSGGRLTGNLQNVTARQKELAAQYQKTVLTAFQEVEDALAALKSNTEQAEVAQRSVAESQNAYNIAKARLDAGAIDYVTFLVTQRSLYQAEDNRIVVDEARLAAFVNLRKALGA